MWVTTSIRFFSLARPERSLEASDALAVSASRSGMPYARPPLGQLSYNGGVLEVVGDDSYFLVVL